MKLKYFEAHGFKSFADKVGLSFEEGITGIVGPNGSGKSNISDAIRWAMGEQSVKYLRGNKMEDVIFSGAGSRRALGMAEVNLLFDNTDHGLGMDFDEVSVRRRVFRSGDSEYYINNKSCRLKDVVQLFADTGLGKGSMSVIGQNRIDEILNSRPEDRRALFEEAAGIAKYRMRKKEALRKLDDTATNLIRINDIKSEIESRIEPLRIQSETASRYMELAEQLRKVQITQFVHRIENIEQVKNKLAAKLEELQQKNAEATANVGSIEARLMDAKLRLDKLNEQYHDLRTVIAEKQNNIEKLHGQENVLVERIANYEKSIARLGGQKEKLQALLTQTEDNLRTMGDEYDGLDNERLQAQQDADALKTQKDELDKNISGLEQQLSEFHSSAFAGMQEIVNLRNEIRGLEESQNQRQRRREQLKDAIKLAEEAFAQLEGNYSALLEEQGSLSANRDIVARQFESMDKEKAELQAGLDACLEERSRVTRRAEQLEARLSILENMLREHEGFGRGVKNLLEANEKWRDDLYGVVAELLSVPDEYVTAIETALGAAQQYLVVKDSSTAKNAINYLKDTKGGRATFLPLNGLRQRELSAKDREVAQGAGVLGWAVDFVQYPADVAGAVRYLLGRILVTRDLDSAIAAAKASGYSLRIVTLEGESIFSGGAMNGGQKFRNESSFLARKKEMDELNAQLEAQNRLLLTAQEKVEAQSEALKAHEQKQAELGSGLQRTAVRLAELAAFLERSQSEKNSQMENITLLQDERSTHNREFLETREKLEGLRPKLTELEQNDTAGKAEADRLQQELESAKGRQSTLQARYQAAAINLESIKERAALRQERMQQVDGEVARLQQDIADCDKEVERTTAAIETAGKEKEELIAQQDTLLQELKNIGSGEDEYKAKSQVIIDEQNGIQEELDAAKKEMYSVQQKVHNAELEQMKQVTEYEGALEQMTNAHKLTPAEARESGIVLEASDTALHRQEVGLNKDIEALGPVNMGAIEEYKAVSERFEFYEKQYNDLFTAREQLEGVVSGINTDMSKRFREAFAKINEYFQQCFTMLFGAGTAKLVMQSDQDILESGVEIIVQPPQKKLQNISLLSGGERALTVIALLFALLSYQPAPFCILDEIDAALDDANIERFAKFLKDYSGNTQFIVITHRKGTMESVDVLHGVTMEDGVSRLVSVKLADIQE